MLKCISWCFLFFSIVFVTQSQIINTEQKKQSSKNILFCQNIYLKQQQKQFQEKNKSQTKMQWQKLKFNLLNSNNSNNKNATIVKMKIKKQKEQITVKKNNIKDKLLQSKEINQQCTNDYINNKKKTIKKILMKNNQKNYNKNTNKHQFTKKQGKQYLKNIQQRRKIQQLNTIESEDFIKNVRLQNNSIVLSNNEGNDGDPPRRNNFSGEELKNRISDSSQKQQQQRIIEHAIRLKKHEVQQKNKKKHMRTNYQKNTISSSMRSLQKSNFPKNSFIIKKPQSKQLSKKETFQTLGVLTSYLTFLTIKHINLNPIPRNQFYFLRQISNQFQRLEKSLLIVRSVLKGLVHKKTPSLSFQKSYKLASCTCKNEHETNDGLNKKIRNFLLNETNFTLLRVLDQLTELVQECYEIVSFIEQPIIMKTKGKSKFMYVKYQGKRRTTNLKYSPAYTLSKFCKQQFPSKQDELLCMSNIQNSSNLLGLKSILTCNITNCHNRKKKKVVINEKDQIRFFQADF